MQIIGAVVLLAHAVANGYGLPPIVYRNSVATLDLAMESLCSEHLNHMTLASNGSC